MHTLQTGWCFYAGLDAAKRSNVWVANQSPAALAMLAAAAGSSPTDRSRPPSESLMQVHCAASSCTTPIPLSTITSASPHLAHAMSLTCTFQPCPGQAEQKYCGLRRELVSMADKLSLSTHRMYGAQAFHVMYLCGSVTNR